MPAIGAPPPDIARLLAVLRGERANRVPNFEICINRANLAAQLGAEPSGESLWNVTPQEAVAFARASGQDAIPCPVQYHGIAQASLLAPADLDRAPPFDFAAKRIKLQSFLAATEATGIGVIPCITGPLTAAYLAVGPIAIQSFLLMIHDDPVFVDRLLDFFVDYDLRLIAAIQDLPFHAYYIGDDVTGFMGPAHLDDLWARRQARIVRAARDTGRPVICHCCGSQREVLPWFSRWGVDAVHPLQPVVNDIYAVREAYPELTLIGNIDVQEQLSFGTPDSVRRDTREHVDRLSRQGRYVVCSSHSIIDSVQPQNYRAMVETAWGSA